MARAIDADKLMEQLQKKKAGPANKRYIEGFNDCLMKVRSMVHSAPTIALPNEPLTCVGCIYEPDCPSEIHCHGCARIFVDHYCRPPEGEA